MDMPTATLGYMEHYRVDAMARTVSPTYFHVGMSGGLSQIDAYAKQRLTWIYQPGKLPEQDNSGEPSFVSETGARGLA